MTRIFVSYSSKERFEALSVQSWLEANGWKDDVFIDIDPKHGLAGGEAWRAALREAAGRCEAVILLLSRSWLESKACWSEFVLAEKYGKPCIPIRIDENVTFSSLPSEIANVYQVIDRVAVPEHEFQARLKRALEIAGAGPENFALPAGRRPYPGLQALNEQDAALFFGRDAEVLAGLDALREMRATGRRRLLVILGASGAGKSSLLRAGLWPRLNRDDRQFVALPVIRPANAVLSGKEGLWLALEKACADLRRERHLSSATPRTRAAIRARVEQDPDAFAMLLTELKTAASRALGDPRAMPSVVLTIDQAEELFNAEGTIEATLLLRLLEPVWAKDPEFLLVLAIRSDVYPRLQSEQRIDQTQVRPFSLPPMPMAALAQVIEGPAERVGLSLDPQLPSALLEDATGADILPLLAFTLERLYEERLESKALRLVDYRSMGGVKGAIEAAVSQARAQAEARGIPGSQLDSLLRRTFLPHLARVNEAGEFARRLADFREFEPQCHALVEVLIAQRLLVTDQRNQTRTVEIAHEAILREWPLLSGWLDAERGFLEWREQIRRARELYRRQQGDLLTGRALLVSQSFLEMRSNSIDEHDRAFIEQSSAAETSRLAEAEAVRESRRLAELEAAKAREEAALTAAAAERKLADSARRTSNRLRLIALLMLALAVGAATSGYFAYRNGTAAEAAAQQASRAADLERTAREQATQALALAESAAQRAEREKKRAEAEADRAEISATLAQSEARRAEASALRAEQARQESESRRLSVLAEDLRQRDTDDKVHALAWLGLPHDTELQSNQITDDAASSIYKRAVYPLRTITDHAKTVFSPTGDLALSVLRTGVAELWDTRTGVIQRTFLGLPKSERYERRLFVSFTQKGMSLLLLYENNVLRHWDVRQNTLLGEYKIRQGDLQPYITVSADLSRMFIVREGGQAEIHDLNNSNNITKINMPTAYFPITDPTAEVKIYVHGTFSNTSRFFVAEFVKGRAGSAELWNAGTGQLIADLPTEGGNISANGVQFTSKDDLLLITPANRDTTLWSPQTGRRIRSYKDLAGATPPLFSADGKNIIGARDNKIVQFRITGELVRTLPPWIDDAHFNRSRTAVITGRAEEAVIWNMETGQAQTRLIGHVGAVRRARISPDGRLALTWSEDGTVKLWDTDRGRLIKTLPRYNANRPDHGPGYWSDTLGFDSSGTIIFFQETHEYPEPEAEGNVIQVIRVHTDKPRSKIAAAPMRSVDFLPDGSRLVISGEDGRARIVSSDTGETISELSSHSGEIVGQHLSADGKWLVTASWDGTAKIWDIATGRLLTTLQGHTNGVTTVQFSSSTRLAATGSHDGTAKLWSVSSQGTSNLLATLDATQSSVSLVSFNRTGDRLIAASLDGKAEMWEVPSGRHVSTLRGHTGAIFALALSTDGMSIITASADHTARIWNAMTGEPLRTLRGHKGSVQDVVWAADGRMIATGSSDKTVKLWDSESTEILATLTGPLDAVRKVKFSPDGKSVFATSADKTLRIWDIETHILLATHAGHDKTPHDFAIRKDGLVAATAGGDGLTNTWHVFPGTLKKRIAEVGESLRRDKPLSAAECVQFRVNEMKDANTVCQEE